MRRGIDLGAAGAGRDRLHESLSVITLEAWKLDVPVLANARSWETNRREAEGLFTRTG